MKRRWIIRSIFMLPILLCLVGWGWSATNLGWVYYRHADYFVACLTIRGAVAVRGGDPSGESMPEGWQYGATHYDPVGFWPLNDSHTFLGFGYYSDSGKYAILMPYWADILAFSTVLFFIWHKTRKSNLATAFPVEANDRSME